MDSRDIDWFTLLFSSIINYNHFGIASDKNFPLGRVKISDRRAPSSRPVDTDPCLQSVSVTYVTTNSKRHDLPLLRTGRRLSRKTLLTSMKIGSSRTISIRSTTCRLILGMSVTLCPNIRFRVCSASSEADTSSLFHSYSLIIHRSHCSGRCCHLGSRRRLVCACSSRVAQRTYLTRSCRVVHDWLDFAPSAPAAAPSSSRSARRAPGRCIVVGVGHSMGLNTFTTYLQTSRRSCLPPTLRDSRHPLPTVDVSILEFAKDPATHKVTSERHSAPFGGWPQKSQIWGTSHSQYVRQWHVYTLDQGPFNGSTPRKTTDVSQQARAQLPDRDTRCYKGMGSAVVLGNSSAVSLGPGPTPCVCLKRQCSSCRPSLPPTVVTRSSWRLHVVTPRPHTTRFGYMIGVDQRWTKGSNHAALRTSICTDCGKWPAFRGAPARTRKFSPKQIVDTVNSTVTDLFPSIWPACFWTWPRGQNLPKLVLFFLSPFPYLFWCHHASTHSLQHIISPDPRPKSASVAFHESGASAVDIPEPRSMTLRAPTISMPYHWQRAKHLADVTPVRESRSPFQQ